MRVQQKAPGTGQSSWEGRQNPATNHVGEERDLRFLKMKKLQENYLTPFLKRATQKGGHLRMRAE